ncbi:MAG: PHP domain-containing protein [Clostridia bacterium]|nr:PHP domain-containing protein [Clostridia bacterium]
MIIYGDYHTHTPYSHGTGTILENAIAAKQKGLKEIAITDHGFNHIIYGIKRSDLKTMKAECIEAEKQTGVKVLLGIEANFISNDGSVDLYRRDFDFFDVVIVGYHSFVRYKNISNQFSMFFRSIFSGIFKPSKKKIEKNTLIYLNAIRKYKINVLSHLNYGMKVDVLKVALAARDKNILIELNGKRISFTDEEILEMAKNKVKFIINSDAHSSDRVGEVNNGINLVTRLNIPKELIVNLDKLPKFKK